MSNQHRYGLFALLSALMIPQVSELSRPIVAIVTALWVIGLILFILPDDAATQSKPDRIDHDAIWNDLKGQLDEIFGDDDE